jgi:hypothetical protein
MPPPSFELILILLVCLISPMVIESNYFKNSSSMMVNQNTLAASVVVLFVSGFGSFASLAESQSYDNDPAMAGDDTPRL